MKPVMRISFLVIFILSTIFPSILNGPIIPVTGLIHDIDSSRLLTLKNVSLSTFISDVYSGNPVEVTGLYATNALKYSVRQQPAGQPGFVSMAPEVVTQFDMASKFGSIGILAHNSLAGKTFFNYRLNQEFVVIYGNGDLKRFKVTEIRKFQALSPSSPYSSFIDLSGAGEQITAADLFYDTYGVENRLVLQTCIEKNNLETWGRLFIIAEPVQLTQTYQTNQSDWQPKSNGEYWIYMASM